MQFEDGSMKAQMGLPDMKLPIQYAIGYPQRLKNNFPRFNFFDYPNLSFEQPDKKTFSNLSLAFSALQKGGNIACALNAANEITVDAFLNNNFYHCFGGADSSNIDFTTLQKAINLVNEKLIS